MSGNHCMNDLKTWKNVSDEIYLFEFNKNFPITSYMYKKNDNVEFVFVGSLMKGSSGLVLGRCEYYNWFTGLMDEVRIQIFSFNRVFSFAFYYYKRKCYITTNLFHFHKFSVISNFVNTNTL